MARKFVYDGKDYPDPNPSKTPDEVRQMFTDFFPELATAEVRETKQGEDTYYEFVPAASPPAPVTTAASKSRSTTASPKPTDPQNALF